MDLTIIAWISLGVAFTCCAVIAFDELRDPQAMGIMNVVWPVSALYFSVFAVWAYYAFGRRKTRSAMQSKGMMKGPHSGASTAPTIAQVAVATSHCGAGCTLADICTEFALAASGLVLFGSVLWTEYLLDLLVAWALGIFFQYFALRPMLKHSGRMSVIWAAIKADTLSIVAFQVGMYAWMALVYFKLFRSPHLTPFDPRYWLQMQIAMVCGFATSLPMNRLLIGMGLKEKM